MFDFWILPIAACKILVVSTISFLASRYKRCPSDKILVVLRQGRPWAVSKLHSRRRLFHLAAQTLLTPYMSLTPMTIRIPLQKALSMQ